MVTMDVAGMPISLITTFNPVCTGDVADREQNGESDAVATARRPSYKANTLAHFDTRNRHLPVYSWRKGVNYARYIPVHAMLATFIRRITRLWVTGTR